MITVQENEIESLVCSIEECDGIRFHKAHIQILVQFREHLLWRSVQASGAPIGDRVVVNVLDVYSAQFRFIRHRGGEMNRRRANMRSNFQDVGGVEGLNE